MRVERKRLVGGLLTPEFEYVELLLSTSEYKDYLSQNKGSGLIISNIEWEKFGGWKGSKENFQGVVKVISDLIKIAKNGSKEEK